MTQIISMKLYKSEKGKIHKWDFCGGRLSFGDLSKLKEF